MTALVSIWPWDDNAMAQAICLVAYWKERPVMSLLRWIDPLRRLEREKPCNTFIGS